MTEQVFFEKDGVKVTNARFIVHSHTYAMNGVTSVKSNVTAPDRKWPLIMIGLGLLILLGADGAGKLFGLLLAGGGGWLLMQLKDTHAVFLSSASGEVQALADQDANYIGSVVNALNDALIHRG